jgi:hypothetical protein
MSTPKQAAARLLLTTLDGGAKSPTAMTREEMAAVLNERVSDQKREKIVAFVGKIANPFRERLTKICGEAAAPGEKDEE